MNAIRFTVTALLLVAATACGKDEPKKAATSDIPSAATQASTAVAEPMPAPAPSKAAQHVEIQIASVANTMAYDKTTLSVPAGAEVHLSFKNNATSSVLSHNWVLVNPGTEASVAAAGLKLGETAGYLDVRDHDVLANTPMAKPGEATDVTFTAPAQPGKYPYICTFPGHYMMMKGVLTVTP